MEKPPLIELIDITKRYANGTLANDRVSFSIQPGSIHAVVGENGAGKSTVMKMLYGLEQPTSGTIRLSGEPVVFHNAHQAIAAGIGLVAQHLTAVPTFTVAENIVLGMEPKRRGLFDRAAANEATRKLSAEYGLHIDPEARVMDLSVGIRQRIEILKTLYRGARILLLDEPTAVLTPQETDGLFAAIRSLVKQGITVVLITHKLVEVKAISDHVTVLRDGRVTGEAPTSELNEGTIAEMMVGRPLTPMQVPRAKPTGVAPVVRARNLGYISPLGQVQLRGITFDVAPGEILGIAGVEGNGQDELARVMGGVLQPTLGNVEIDSTMATGLGVRETRALGVAAVPEDRLYNGCAPALSINDNMAATNYFTRRFSRLGTLKQSAIRTQARLLIERFGVKTASGMTPIGALSGGNMQKVIMARECAGEPDFLIASQPTRGVDIGAAGLLRDELVKLRDQGTAILLISADLEEVIQLSDRIAVLFKGEIVAQFAADTADAKEIGLYMTGLARQSGVDCRMADEPLRIAS